MLAIDVLKSWVHACFIAYREARGHPDDALEVVEKVVIVALSVTAALAIVGILVLKATQKANDTNL